MPMASAIEHRMRRPECSSRWRACRVVSLRKVERSRASSAAGLIQRKCGRAVVQYRETKARRLKPAPGRRTSQQKEAERRRRWRGSLRTICPDSRTAPAASYNREWPDPWPVLVAPGLRSRSSRARKRFRSDASRSSTGRGRSDSRRRATKPRPASPLPIAGIPLEVRATRFVSSPKRRRRQPLGPPTCSPHRFRTCGAAPFLVCRT